MNRALVSAIVGVSLVGCTHLPSVNKHAFNNAYDAFQKSTYISSKQLDTTITVRIRAFGSQDEKCQVWRLEFPQYPCPGAGAHVSTEPAQIWLDLRESDRGQTVSTVVLGHEIKHELQKAGLENPDNE